MSTKKQAADNDANEINLKHRITGAGVLIFFGVLVLPWLLGPPSEATKNPVVSEPSIAPLHSTFDDEILAELEGGQGAQFQQPEESVYISKITPLGESSDPKIVAAEGNENSMEKAEPDAKTDANTIDKSKTVSADQASGGDSVASSSSSKTTTETATNTVDKSDSTNLNPQSQPKQPVVKTASIDVGWVVQVELLTDKNGAKRLVEELRSKGFSPSTTIVDTNRGVKTGTRIWIGPYAQRAQAGLKNDELEKKMGKRGFIRVYP